MKIKSWDITLRDVPSTISNSGLGAFDGNTVQPTENDEFFTTDTEAFLIFNLLDEDFHPKSATITLHNRTDGSVVNEDVPVASGVIEYEMRREVIEHAGGWQAQLVYEQDKDGVPEKYTSKVVGFNVAGHLLDTKEPALVVIKNWNNFVLSAESLIEDWEHNEALRAAAERERDAAEDKRASTFTYNENSRKTEFETNETERQSEFEENELARESAESVRVVNEAERITNDSERDSKIEEIERVATEPPKPIHTLKVENEVFSSDEVSVSEGVITINNHNLKVGDKVAFVATATPYNVFEPFEGAMRLNTVYYVVNPSSDSFQISTTQNGEPIVFNIDAKGFLWQFEKVSVNSLQVSGLDGTNYRAVFTGAHDGGNSARRLLNVYTNPGNTVTRYSSEDIRPTITAADINPVHGVMDIYSEMIFKVINRKILITVDSSFTTIDESGGNHSEKTYGNRILTETNNPVVGFQDSINLIGVGSKHLFDGSTLEVYEA